MPLGDEAIMTMEHDFFVKKGTLLVKEIITGGGFGNMLLPPMVQQKKVAIKIFRQNVDIDAVRRMLLETKILTMFRNHSNIIQLLGFCTENIHKGI